MATNDTSEIHGLGETEQLVSVPRYLSVEECVSYMNGHLSRFRIYKMLQDGELRGYQPGGKSGRWLIRADDFIEFIERGSNGGPVGRSRES